MNHRKRRSKNVADRFNFQQLEGRRMLAAGPYDVTATSITNNNDDLSVATSIVSNGDFSDALNGTSAALFGQGDVGGWSIVGGDGDARFQIFNIADAGNVLDLDSTADNFDQVFQDVVTENAEYLLSFESIARNAVDGQSETTHSFEVLWAGESLGTFDAQAGWQTTQILVSGTSDLTRLEFREIADVDNPNGDGRGALLDNIRLTRVTDSSAVTNGSFESFTGTAGLIETDLVNGWSSFGATPGTLGQLEIVEDAAANDGDHVLEIDTSSDLIDRVFQDVATEANQDYFLVFDLRSGDTTDQDDNELRVRFDNQWAGTFQGTEDWTTHSIFVNASTDLTRVVFREAFADGVTEFGSGSGPLVDNIRLFEVGLTPNAVQIDLNGGGVGADADGAFEEDAGPTAITTDDLVLTNNVGDTIQSATVQIVGGVQDTNSEVLAVAAAGTNISDSYDSTTGTLILSGVDSVANYESVLRSLTYQNISQTPTETARQISVSVTADEITSFASTIDLQVESVNDLPSIFELSDVARTVDADLTFSVFAQDLDNSASELSYEVAATGSAVDGAANQPTISQTGLISWTPSQTGDATITVTVTDAEGGSSVTSFDSTIVTPFLNDGSIGDLAPELRTNLYAEAPPINIDFALDYEAIIELENGDELRFELFDDDAPITVNSFINLARDGFYDGVTFHRVVDDFSARVAQGGDPSGTGSGGPGYTIPLEVGGEQRFDSIGVLGMARAAALDSGGSQFFITLADQDSFTNSFTVFGDLISGQTPLENITLRDPNTATEPGDVITTIRIEEV